MFRVAVINSKGGSGKTTLAVNLAGWLTAQGHRVAVVDYDPQGSSLAWIGRRPPSAPRIHGIKANDIDFRNSRCYRLVDGLDITHLIIDTPAAIAAQNLIYFVRDAHRVLVPVMPSAIDIHAATRVIQNLLLQAGLRKEPERLGIVMSRTRDSTVAHRSLQRFLQAMDLRIVTTVRDSQVYVRTAEAGLGVAELPPKLAAQDIETWRVLGEWLADAQQKVQEAEARPMLSVVSAIRPAPVARALQPAASAPTAPTAPTAPQSQGTEVPAFLRGEDAD